MECRVEKQIFFLDTTSLTRDSSIIQKIITAHSVPFAICSGRPASLHSSNHINRLTCSRWCDSEYFYVMEVLVSKFKRLWESRGDPKELEGKCDTGTDENEDELEELEEFGELPPSSNSPTPARL